MCKLLLSRGASLDARNNDGDDPESQARVYNTTAADFLAAVRAAGGWLPWLNAPRTELIALRRRLPALRDRGGAGASVARRAALPEDARRRDLARPAFWRSDRDD
ncbi:hypothetical protein JL720_1915 [Aureococcus anophagefferens]|nr:hypothetical protein JL720_1915 [Aureococcus anophagefferens]